jgi:hypothetical protein
VAESLLAESVVAVSIEAVSPAAVSVLAVSAAAESIGVEVSVPPDESERVSLTAAVSVPEAVSAGSPVEEESDEPQPTRTAATAQKSGRRKEVFTRTIVNGPPSPIKSQARCSWNIASVRTHASRAARTSYEGRVSLKNA